MIRAIVAIAAILFGACSVASPSPAPSAILPTAAVATVTATPPASSTATTPGSTLRFGLVTQDGLGFPSGLRLESDPSPFARIQSRSVSVSPDGRRIAYWHVPSASDDTAGELRTLDLVTGVESVTLLTSAPERAGGIAWRSDGSALVVATASASLAFGGADPPPAYTRVRTIDLASKQLHELARLDASRFFPVAWSAETKIVVGVDSGEGGTHGIFRIREDGTRIAGGPIDVGYQRFDATRDGRTLLGLAYRGEGNRVYSTAQLIAADSPIGIGAREVVDDLAREVVDDRYIIDARFLPTNEIAVLLRAGTPQRYGLEVWPAGLAGQGRRIWTSPDEAPFANGDLFARVDGRAVYLRGAEATGRPSPWLRIDLDTGSATELPAAAEPLSGLSFYVSDAAMAKLRS
jgi:hypothetical protein